MTEPLTSDDLAEARRLCDAATPGPWYWQHDIEALCASAEEQIIWPQNSLSLSASQVDFRNMLGSCGDHAEVAAKDNAAFIAASRSLLPRLLDEVQRLRAEIDHLDDLISDLRMQ